MEMIMAAITPGLRVLPPVDDTVFAANHGSTLEVAVAG